jgi:uncharacterized protein
MSNADIVKGMYDSFARGDIQSVLETLDPNVEWTDAEGFPTGGTYMGPQAVLENVIMPLGATWDGFQIHIDKLVDGGNDVVMLGTYTGTCKATGKSMRASAAHAWTLSRTVKPSSLCSMWTP